MTLVLEDGTGIYNANSYVSVIEADAYFVDRGIEDWSDLSTGDKEFALIKATDYLQRHYANGWVGTVATSVQRLYWPRVDAYGRDRILRSGVPREVKEATYELALRSLDGTLLPDQATDTGTIKRSTKKAGPVEVTQEYTTSSTIPKFHEVDGALWAILKGSSSGSKLAIRV